ncbi:hypothetical protein Q4566_05110 [Tamlana sp. 2_MG-2023]|nr:hypothetical protein [Tamlana sp. 1_MG-2023]MDO6759572.1 hypothetical protein [Tamlana sp. 2_MG-2023]
MDKIIFAAKEIIAFYGEDAKLAYISNRTNSYSTDPQDWANITANSNQLVATAIVSYNQMGRLNANLEKHFSKLEMHICYSLEEAVTWVNSLKVLA